MIAKRLCKCNGKLRINLNAESSYGITVDLVLLSTKISFVYVSMNMNFDYSTITNFWLKTNIDAIKDVINRSESNRAHNF